MRQDGWSETEAPYHIPWGGSGSKDWVSDVYQQSSHRGSLAPLTIRPQHLAVSAQEARCNFPSFTELAHTPAASHVPPQDKKTGMCGLQTREKAMETSKQQTKREWTNIKKYG